MEKDPKNFESLEKPFKLIKNPNPYTISFLNSISSWDYEKEKFEYIKWYLKDIFDTIFIFENEDKEYKDNLFDNIQNISNIEEFISSYLSSNFFLISGFSFDDITRNYLYNDEILIEEKKDFFYGKLLYSLTSSIFYIDSNYFLEKEAPYELIYKKEDDKVEIKYFDPIEKLLEKNKENSLDILKENPIIIETSIEGFVNKMLLEKEDEISQKEDEKEIKLKIYTNINEKTDKIFDKIFIEEASNIIEEYYSTIWNILEFLKSFLSIKKLTFDKVDPNSYSKLYELYDEIKFFLDKNEEFIKQIVSDNKDLEVSYFLLKDFFEEDYNSVNNWFLWFNLSIDSYNFFQSNIEKIISFVTVLRIKNLVKD